MDAQVRHEKCLFFSFFNAPILFQDEKRTKAIHDLLPERDNFHEKSLYRPSVTPHDDNLVPRTAPGIQNSSCRRKDLVKSLVIKMSLAH